MIHILSRNEAVAFIKSSPTFPIIAIGESNTTDVKRLTSIAKNCLYLEFDDLEYERPGHSVVTQEHVQQALAWAKDKNDLIVACRAGISRSSAIAYLIEASKSSPEHALQILNMRIHQPNRLVIKKGAELLGNAIFEAVDSWQAKLYQLYL